MARKNKKLREASNKLLATICPSGPTYRPPWFNTLGLDETNNVIVVYTSKPRPAHKALQKILTDKKFEGFRVIVKRMGPIALCKEDLRQEPAPDTQPATNFLSEEDKVAWEERMKDLEAWGREVESL